MRRVASGKILLDARRFEDVTLEGENARVVFRELKQEIDTVLNYIDRTGNNSVLSSVISDSVNFNREAKSKLADMFPKILFLPCHAHQLNLMAGNFLTHESTESIVTSAKDIINFFFIYNIHMRRLQTIMTEDLGRRFEFVKSVDTRWFSHYKMVLTLFKARTYLEKYKDSLQDDDDILKEDIACRALDAIGSKRFWRKLGLIADVLRIVTIEIGNIEKRGATLSDVVQSFGRIWAYIQNTNVFEAQRFSSLPGFLDDMLIRLEWRLNIYFSIDILVLAHVLDPALGMRGLKSPEFNKRKVYNIIQTVAQRFDHSLAEDYSRKTALRKEFVEYLLLIRDDNFTPPDNPFVYWSSTRFRAQFYASEISGSYTFGLSKCC